MIPHTPLNWRVKALRQGPPAIQHLTRQDWETLLEQKAFAGLGLAPITRPVAEAFSGSGRGGIDACTRYCAVYGYPVRHSASPAMHNAALEALGLNWRYLAFEVHPDQLRAALEGARRMKFIGLNLTVPHKVLALDMVDELDATARKWGAVNTIRFEARDGEGHWQPLGHFSGSIPEDIRAHGFNTDAEAIVRSLREDLGVKIERARVLVLGTGGAGRVAALKLAEAGAGELFLVNRTRGKAESVAEEMRAAYPGVKATVGYPGTAVDLLLNATSLGLNQDDPMPWEADQFPLKNAAAVYDMIYRPAETPLLAAARAAGCRVANGLGMLLHQGMAALELWSRRSAPAETMKQALVRNIYGH